MKIKDKEKIKYLFYELLKNCDVFKVEIMWQLIEMNNCYLNYDKNVNDNGKSLNNINIGNSDKSLYNINIDNSDKNLNNINIDNNDNSENVYYSKYYTKIINYESNTLDSIISMEL